MGELQGSKSGERTPLTSEQRDELVRRKEGGDESMVCSFGDDFDWCVAHPEGGIVTPLNGHCDPLTADEARSFSIALLQAADHAEFGPGEWRDGEWKSR